MKSITLTTALFATLTTVSGQDTIEIGNPRQGSVVTHGSELIVQVIKSLRFPLAFKARLQRLNIFNWIYRIMPNQVLDSTEIGIAIGVQSCALSSCSVPISVLGTVLYSGPYAPAFHGPGSMYQNFTITLPSDILADKALLGVIRAFLLGVDPTTTLDSTNIDVNIE